MRSGFPVKRVDRYIAGQLTLALVLVTAGLVALIWLTQSLRFIQIIVNRGLSPLVFVKLTALLVPAVWVGTVPGNFSSIAMGRGQYSYIHDFLEFVDETFDVFLLVFRGHVRDHLLRRKIHQPIYFGVCVHSY